MKTSHLLDLVSNVLGCLYPTFKEWKLVREMFESQILTEFISYL